MALYEEITMSGGAAGDGLEHVGRTSRQRLARAGFVLAAAAAAVAIGGGTAIVLSGGPDTVDSDAAAAPGAAAQGTDAVTDEGEAADPAEEVTPVPAGDQSQALCGSTLPAELRLFPDEDPSLVHRTEQVGEDGRLVHTASFEDLRITVTWPMVDRADTVQPRPAWDDLGHFGSVSDPSDGSVRVFLNWNTAGRFPESPDDLIELYHDIEITDLHLDEGPCGAFSISGSVAGEVSPPFGFDVSGQPGRPTRISRDPLVAATADGVEPPPVDESYHDSCPAATVEPPAAYFETPEEALEARLIAKGWSDYAGSTRYTLAEDRVAFALWLHGDRSEPPIFVFRVERHDQGWTVASYDVGSGC